MRLLKLSIALSAMVLAAAGCVYPFDPVIENTDGRLVVEGDIHVGSVSDFTFSRVYPIYSEDINVSAPIVSGYIEGEDGTRLESTPVPPDEYGHGKEYGSYSLRFDTTDLTSGQKYRLHFEEQSSGTVYESDWIGVCPPPVIDDLSYILNEERGEMNVALSMHCNGRSHFRWHYDEEWEYHARDWARHYYDPDSDTVKEYEDGVNTFYCWSSFQSPEIKIFSTADQVDDRFVDLEFHRIQRTEQRIMVLYHITVYLEALDEEAYKYWNNIRQNSSNQGTIFSPTPSQMQGNIHCISNPSVQVIGYVSAAEQCVADMYYDNAVEKFYKSPYTTPIIEEEVEPVDFYEYYRRGYAVYYIVEDIGSPTVYVWTSESCVDCRKGGGTKNKPSYWPNNHI